MYSLCLFSLLRVRDSDGFAENQEQLIRGMLKEFPYVECQLLQQMIRTISSSSPELVSSTQYFLSVILSLIYKLLQTTHLCADLIMPKRYNAQFPVA